MGKRAVQENVGKHVVRASIRVRIVKGFLFGLLILLLGITSVFPGTFDTNSQSTFDNGTYVNTSYNASGGFVQLDPSNTSGTYTSKVFDSGLSSSQWHNISWIAGGPYGQELPDNQGVESVLGGANMTGNVLLMHMNEASGTIVDSSGSGNNGTAHGVTYGAAGKFNSALSFDGTNDWIDMASPDFGTSDFTFTAWIKSNDISANKEIIRANDAFPNDGYIMRLLSSGRLQGYIRAGGGGTGSADDGTVLDDGVWHHVAVVFDRNGNMTRYVDGVVDGSVTDISGESGSINVVADLAIGAYDGGTNVFNGEIDEVTIFNRTLSDEEVLNHYKRGALRLNLSVRSCDDAACSGESYTDVVDTSPQTFTEEYNRYFQFNFDFEADNSSVTPELYNVTIDYTPLSNAPPYTPVLNSPVNNSLFGTDRRFAVLNATVTDPEGDNMTVRFYGDGSLINTTYNVTNGSTVAYNWTGLSYGLHNWSVTVGDGEFNTSSGTYYFVISTEFIVNDQTTFDWGSYVNTSFNSSGGFVQLDPSNTSGTYTSKVFDSGFNMSRWNNISWTQGGAYGQELPDNQGVESVLGGANMTGNVLLMHMNEGSGTIVDSSGNGNNGTTYGSITYGATGKFNSALSFDGSNDYVDAGNGLNATYPELSVEAWVKRNEQGVNHIIASSGRFAAGFSGFSLYLTSGNAVSFILRNTTSGKSATGGSYPADNDWHHVVGTSNTSGVYAYLDGNLVASNPNSLTIPYFYYTTKIGQEGGFTTNDNGRYQFNGSIDEVAIWNRSLSADEILDIYKRGALRLNLSVRSCDDPACSGESYVDVGDTSPQDLSVGYNRYFQFKYGFESNNASLSPELYNVTVDYTPFSNAPPNTPVLSSPQNNSMVYTDYAVLNATVTDIEGDNMTVRFYGDGALINTTYNVTNGSAVTYNWTSLAYGTHNWSVTAGDGSDNTSSDLSFFIKGSLNGPIVETPKTYSTGLVEKNSFQIGEVVRIRVNVTDHDGSSDLDSTLINITNPTGALKVSNGVMTKVSSVTNGYTYEYNYTVPSGSSSVGTWTLNITANDTVGNPSNSNSTTFDVKKCYGTEGGDVTVSSSVTMYGTCSYNSLTVTGSGVVQSSNGRLTLNVTDNVTVSGTISAGSDSLTIYGGNLTVNTGGRVYANGSSGQTGGDISISVDTMVVNGTVTANGGAKTVSWPSSNVYGGDGGRININATTLMVIGTLTADGGKGKALYDKFGVGGDGGRITINATSIEVYGTVQAKGGIGQTYDGNNGGSGGDGGIITLNTETLNISGTVNANGNYFTVRLASGTGGSGGTLNITTSTLNLSGNLTANGGDIVLQLGGSGSAGPGGQLDVRVSQTFSPSSASLSAVKGSGGGGSNGSVNVWYGSNPYHRCNNTAATINPPATYYYGYWSNTTAYRCVWLEFDQYSIFDGTNQTDGVVSVGESFYPSVRIRENDGSNYYYPNGSWNLTKDGVNYSMVDTRLGYVWRGNQSFSESTAGSYSFLSNVTGQSAVGMIATSLNNNHSYTVVPPVNVEGAVVDGSGNPLVVNITVYNTDGATVMNTSTDSSFNFTMPKNGFILFNASDSKNVSAKFNITSDSTGVVITLEDYGANSPLVYATPGMPIKFVLVNSTNLSYSSQIGFNTVYEQSEAGNNPEPLLKLFQWNGSAWNLKDSEVNPSANTINASLMSLGYFVLTYQGPTLMLGTNRFIVKDGPWGYSSNNPESTKIRAYALVTGSDGLAVSGASVNFKFYNGSGGLVWSVSNTTDAYGLASYVRNLAGKADGNWKVTASATVASRWNNISWAIGGPYGQELPDNQQVETSWPSGNANMTGNVLLMHMNETSGTIVDSSGSGNNGTSSGGVTYGASGKFDRALGFDGVNDYIRILDDASIRQDLNNGFTVSLWVYPTESGRTQMPLSKAGDYRIAQVSSDVWRFQYRNGTGSWAKTFNSNVNVTFNTWQFLTVTFNGSELFWYINGNEVATKFDTVNFSTSNDLLIGTDTVSSSRYFNGTIDEVAIYNRSLSADEILNNYKRGALRLNLSVRSCDDAACSGESFTDVVDTSPQDLSVGPNRYFQFNFDFETDDSSYTPELYNVTVDDTPAFMANDQTSFNEGFYVNTSYNVSAGFVQLDPTNTSGSYTSKVFDSGVGNEQTPLQSRSFKWNNNWGSPNGYCYIGCHGDFSNILQFSSKITNSPYTQKVVDYGHAIDTYYSSGFMGHWVEANKCVDCHKAYGTGSPGTYTPYGVHKGKRYCQQCHTMTWIQTSEHFGYYKPNMPSCSGCHPIDNTNVTVPSTKNGTITRYSDTYPATGSPLKAHKNVGNVPCVVCHGPMHNVTKPDPTPANTNSYTEDSHCKKCHTPRTEHNNSVKCTVCHSQDVHNISFVNETGQYVKDKSDAMTCTPCHQTGLFNTIVNQNKSGSYTGSGPPQIPYTKERYINHSNTNISGKKWNETSPGYWGNGTPRALPCNYCHGDSGSSAGMMHSSEPLGRVEAAQSGNNSLNGTIDANSYWCGSCHYPQNPYYSNMTTRLTADGLELPPDNTNETGSDFNNHSANWLTEPPLGASDAKCATPGCHGTLLSTNAKMDEFVHNVAEGEARSFEDCNICHDQANNYVPTALINLSAFNSTTVDPGLNDPSVVQSANRTLHGDINEDGVSNNSDCMVCHYNISGMGSGYSVQLFVSGDPATKGNTFYCTVCHLVNTSYSTGNTEAGWPYNGSYAVGNPPKVYTHTPYKYTYRYSNVGISYGDVAEFKDNRTPACEECHNNSVYWRNFSDSILKTVVHYGKYYNLTTLGFTDQNTTRCAECHRGDASTSSPERASWGVNGTTLSEAFVGPAPPGQIDMGTADPTSRFYCWTCHLAQNYNLKKGGTPVGPSSNFHAAQIDNFVWNCNTCH